MSGATTRGSLSEERFLRDAVLTASELEAAGRGTNCFLKHTTRLQPRHETMQIKAALRLRH